MHATPSGHTKQAAALAAALVVTSSIGCLQGVDEVAGRPVSLRDGFLAGDFGTRRGIVGTATRLEATSDRESLSSSVHVVREQRGIGTGMVIVSLSGLTLDDLEPGEHAFSYDEATLETQSIFVNVCSGDSDVAFDYDVPAARGVLVVSDPAVNDDGRGVVEVDVHTETPRADGDGVEITDATFSFTPSR